MFCEIYCVLYDKCTFFRVLAQLEAVEPIHPDDQLNMLKDIVDYEQGLLVREEDICHMQRYLAEVTKYNT